MKIVQVTNEKIIFDNGNYIGFDYGENAAHITMQILHSSKTWHWIMNLTKT